MAKLPSPQEVIRNNPENRKALVAAFVKRHKLLELAARQVLRVKAAVELATILHYDDQLDELNKWHGLWKLSGMEGFMRPQQAAFFEDLIREKGIRTVGEIGFNGGHSAWHFLSCSPEITVVSFDNMAHPYTRPTADFMRDRFPGRFTLVEGDSTATVPQYAVDNPGLILGLVFVDGSHDFNTALSDLSYMRRFANNATIVVLDDVDPNASYGQGPTRAWQAALVNGILVQDGLYQGDGRMWAVGHYCK